MTPPTASDKPSSWRRGVGRLRLPGEPRFEWLLVALLLLVAGQVMLAGALADEALGLDLVFAGAVAIVGLATVPLLPTTRLVRVGHAALCAFSIAIVLAGPLATDDLHALARLILVAFFGTVTVWTVWHLALAQRVTGETLVGAMCGYLLLGIAFAQLFSIVELLHPGALRLDAAASGSPAGQASAITYFSFITLTTVGYGDFVPVSAGARFLAMAEGFAGQLYIAAVVARVVSLLVSSPRADAT